MQNEAQSQLLNAQMRQILEAKANVKQALIETSSCHELKLPIGLPEEPRKASDKALPELCDANKSVKAHLKDIIYFVLKNFGALSDEEIETEKLKYRNNQELTKVFEVLLIKYSTTVKTKEEIIKYTFRKAVKFMRQKYKKGLGSNETQKKTFNTFLEEMDGKIEDDDDCEIVMKNPLPVKQNAKNNNISTEVIVEAFTSEEFCLGFREYLLSLDRTLELDNNKKIDKFVKSIETSMKKNSIKDIRKYKRIPWLKTWIENTKRIAHELLNTHKVAGFDESRKLVKKEEYYSGTEGCSDETFSTKVEDQSE